MVVNGERLQRDGRPQVVLTIEDVTQQRQAERARTRMAEIEAAATAKDQFLAMLSQELRTPWTPVLLAASELKDRADLPAEVREELAVMCRDLGMEARLIDDL